MNIEDKVMRELEKKTTAETYQMSKQAEQREDFRKLKEMLNQAGYSYGDKYQIPLSHRLGFAFQIEQRKLK
jgi:hypothetical protein